MMSGAPSISLWVRAEPFSYGALQIAPHPRLTFNNIKKIVIYAKNKGNIGFPNIKYKVWRHIACNKLHLAEDLAWMYFCICHVYSENISPVERAEWDIHFSELTSDEERDREKDEVSVGLYKFVLFLYMQQLHKVSLKASLVAGEEWPTVRPSSPDVENRTPRGSKILDDHNHLVFIQNNIVEILDLLSDIDNKTGESILSMQGAEALGFLIAGSLDHYRTLVPIQDIAVLQSLQQKSGLTKGGRHFKAKLFASWIKEGLIQNPFGISACISNGRRLSWPMPGEDKNEGHTSKRGKIACNGHIVPKEHMKGNKIIIMSQVSKQTIARSSGTLEFSSIKIHRCHYSYLYLLSPLRSVTVEKCRNSTIVLGPVETSVHLNQCENVTLITVARVIMISGSTLCSVYSQTPNRNILLSGNDSVMLAPYHTFYPKLEEHMAIVGISTACNYWDMPICVGPDHRDDMPVWEIMSVAEFFTFNIPFEMPGPTKSIPGGLPTKYEKSVSQRHKKIDAWQKTVKDAKLTKEQRKEFQVLVESRFHTWLAESCYKRELDFLVSQPPPLAPQKK